MVQTRLQSVLEEELGKLKRLLTMRYELKVEWLPNKNSKLAGEVKGKTILIYKEEEKEAKETLRHEFIDHAISKVVEPYKEVTNKLISVINEDAYRRKEKLVEASSQLLIVYP